MRFALCVRGHGVDDVTRRVVESVVRALCASTVELEVREDGASQGIRLVSLDSTPERHWILRKPRHSDVIMAFREAGVPFRIS